MNKYDMILEGKIVVIRNFVFEDGKLDHAWNTGRICLVVYADDNYEYVLPITHAIKDNCEYHHFYIDKSSFLDFYSSRYKEKSIKHKKKDSKNNQDVCGYINIKKLYKFPVAYRDEIGKLNYDCFKKILSKLHYFHDTKSIEELISKSI